MSTNSIYTLNLLVVKSRPYSLSLDTELAPKTTTLFIASFSSTQTSTKPHILYTGQCYSLNIQIRNLNAQIKMFSYYLKIVMYIQLLHFTYYIFVYYNISSSLTCQCKVKDLINFALPDMGQNQLKNWEVFWHFCSIFCGHEKAVQDSLTEILAKIFHS